MALAGLCFAGPALAINAPVKKLPSTRTMMANMSRDNAVQAARVPFLYSSQTAMFYHLCATKLSLPQEQTDFSVSYYKERWKAYYMAFIRSHVQLTGKEPTQETIQAILARMKTEQDNAAIGIGQQVQQQPDCQLKNLQDLQQALAQLQQQAKVREAQEAAAAKAQAEQEARDAVQ